MPGRTAAYLGLSFFTSGQAADKKGPAGCGPDL